MKVKLSDIIDAIEMTDQYSEYFLDKETGKVEWVSDMAMTQEELASAIQGKGAFRRFKDTVIRLGIDQEWYDFQSAEYKRKAARWCEDNGIEYEET